MSVYYDILSAVKSKIDALGLANLTPDRVEIRKKAVYLAEHDSTPLLVVSPVLDQVQERQFDANGFFRYEVRVTIYHEQGVSWQVTEWLLGVREDLRGSLFQPTLAGASSVFDVAWSPDQVYDSGVLPVGVDVSRMSVIYTASEGV